MDGTAVSGTDAAHPDGGSEGGEKGALKGTVVTKADLDKQHPLVLESDFPCFRGRFGNGTYPEIGAQLADDLARHAGVIGHIHVAEPPGRGLPQIAGGIPWREYVRIASAAGYR